MKDSACNWVVAEQRTCPRAAEAAADEEAEAAGHQADKEDNEEEEEAVVVGDGAAITIVSGAGVARLQEVVVGVVKTL